MNTRRTQRSEESAPFFRHLINKLVGFESAQKSSIIKKWPGEFFFVSAWSLLDIADIGLGRFPLPYSPSHIIRSDYCHLLNNGYFSSSTIQLCSSLMSSFSSEERLVIFFLASSRLRSRISLRTSGLRAF